MLPFIQERKNDYDANYFLNELANASKNLGVLETKFDEYPYNSILVPMLQIKEGIATINIEGTEATVSDVYVDEANEQAPGGDVKTEVTNNSRALVYGAQTLSYSKFTNTFIKELHQIRLSGIGSTEDNAHLGEYKKSDNVIKNSYGRVVYTPPSADETQRYMDEWLEYVNCENDGVHPLIKAAIMHAQFESIHPFDNGNGRVGRILVCLYLFKAKVINFPFFYISEAISQDKQMYYHMLTNSRESSYNEWIKYFLGKIAIQAKSLCGYIDSLNVLYQKTYCTVKKQISTKADEILECLFTNPVTTVNLIQDQLNISHSQSIRYLNILENSGVLVGNDRKRGRTYYFQELLNLAAGNNIF